LIGINNAIMNPYFAKGIGFSIRIDILREFKPEPLDLPSPVNSAEQQEAGGQPEPPDGENG
jgi:hypothetical protein